MRKVFLLLTVLAMSVCYALGQGRTVTGVVTSSEDGGSLPQLSVLIKGTTMGVVTDMNGRYSINVSGPEAVLLFKYTGYESQEVVVGERSEINVVMKPALEEIGQVVVVGYGTVKKSEVTGAVSSVDARQLEGKPVVSISQALQGKVAGVSIQSASGRAGDNTIVSVRGAGSLNASNDVLYVIDGVPTSSMGSLSAEDIENFEVLKDAASAAIYGSRASNGVVLITTKTGGKGGASVVSVTSSVGIQEPVKLPRLLNAEEYWKIHEVSRLNALADAKAKKIAPLKKFTIPMEKPTVDVDHLKSVLRPISIYHRHQVSFEGSHKNTHFYISGTYTDQLGILKGDYYKGFKTRANVEHRFNRVLKIGLQSYATISKARPLEGDNNMYSPWVAALNAHPNVSARNEEGKIYKTPGFINPLAVTERYYDSQGQRFGGTFNIDISPVEGLVFRNTFTGDIVVNRSNQFDPPSSLRGKNSEGYGMYRADNDVRYQIENILTYTGYAVDNKFSYTAMVGHSYYKLSQEYGRVEGTTFILDELRWLDVAGKITAGTSTTTGYALESYFGRLQLGWDNKYQLMASIRTDGSSKFNKDNRWGIFPAVSVGWNIHNESFMQFDVLNELKLRASFGLTGNQGGISNTSGQNLLTLKGIRQDGRTGIAATKIYNPNLHWEKGYSTNVGVDLEMFSRRFNVTLDFYNKITDDLLYAVDIPHESGFQRMLTNDGGKILNRGIELTIGGTPVLNDIVEWTVSANFTYNHNEVLKLSNPKGYYKTGFLSIVKEGYPLSSFYILEAEGISEEWIDYKDSKGNIKNRIGPGDVLYKDQNGDGLIDEEDYTVFSGGIAPMFGGISTSVYAYNFDFTLAGTYVLGRKLYANYKKDGTMSGAPVGAPAYSNNMEHAQLDYWTPDNRGSKVPRPHMDPKIAEWNNRHSTRFLEDASYFRCSEITLGYNFAKTWKIPYISHLRLYAQVRNAFTLTKYSGMDPEVNYSDASFTNSGVDHNSIPNMRVYALGLEVKF